jgi:hypothetical protein
MNTEEKRGVYKFLHWACFVASCLAVISAYIVQGMENMGSDNTGVVMFAHTAALAVFIAFNFLGWCINNYLIGNNKVYPFKADDRSLNKYVIAYTFVLLLILLFG